ncbi:MAG: FAD-binding oxidoreductase [Caldilineaceae bacterium]
MITLNETTVATLRSNLRGDLLTPEDAGYDETRRIWNAMIDRRPALIARCTGAVDVIEAVNFARAHDLPVSIRGGGHNVAGYALCDGGLMIDLARMNGVWVDPQRRTARVQGGALWGDVDRETQLFGLATPGGVVSHTGVAGLTLGGGFGYLSRQYGLTCDNLLSADIVTADGRLIHTSAEEHPELFWAIQGGGGNFGVVTSFEFQLHSVGPMVTAGLIFFPFDQARTVLQGFRDYAATAPRELFCIPLLRIAPPAPFLPSSIHGKRVVGIVACHIGALADGEAAVRPLRTLGDAVVDLIVPKPYVVHQAMLDATQPHGRCYYWKSEYLPDLSDGVIDTAIEHAEQLTSPFSLIGFFQLGGAIRDVAAQAAAYGRRDAGYALNIACSWQDPHEADKHIAWTRQLWRAMQPYSTGGGYINFLSQDDDNTRVQGALGGPNYARLVAVKNQYDPTNFFHMNQNIKPTV